MLLILKLVDTYNLSFPFLEYQSISPKQIFKLDPPSPPHTHTISLFPFPESY